MDKFLKCIQTANLVEFFLDKVFYCLYVMVGHLLNVLDTSSLPLVKLAVDVT